MSGEIKDLMEKIDLSRDKIFHLTSKCLEFITNHPGQVQKLVDVWCKSAEVSSQKLAFLFFCNDLIRNSNSESIKPLFQISLNRVITLACSDFSAIGDVRKLLKIWNDFQIFSRVVVEDWEKICDRAEQFGSVTERSNYLHIITFGKKLKSLKTVQGMVSAAEGEEKLKLMNDEQKHREELIREIINCMKKVFHGQLEITICLQRMNKKINGVYTE